MAKGLTRDKGLEIVDLTKNQFYAKRSDKKPGKAPTVMTLYRDPQSLEKWYVNDEDLMNEVVAIKLNPNLPNHYRLICTMLCIKGYYINHKKLYRLMKEYHLLNDKKKHLGRAFVKYARIAPERPLQGLEMDIKHVKVHGNNAYAYVLTVIDTFTRFVLEWSVGFTMKSVKVKEVWENIIVKYLQNRRLDGEPIDIEIRTDNGKQFISKMIQQFFVDNKLNHVCTHPYTPQENGHVESFHGIMADAIDNEYFDNLDSLQRRLEEFYENYNQIRGHGSICGLPPAIFWNLYEKDLVTVNIPKPRVVKFKLKVAYQDILTIPDISNYRGTRA
jgi:transposase InsO family protein